MKSLRFLGLIVLAAAALRGQPPTTGAQWWSTTPIDCSSVDNVPVGSSYTISLPSGATGYYCYVSGTFVWLAAGGGYTTSLRVAAPASGNLGVDYTFYDTAGNNFTLDTTSTCSSSPASGNEVACALAANQPAEVALLGAPNDTNPTDRSQHFHTQDGSVFVQLYCANATTCLVVTPQLIYSAPPSISLSVPIAWDGNQWTQWSTEGFDNGGSNQVSLVIYNQGNVATIYTVRVFDSNGNQVGIGTTPAIPGYSTTTGEAGTYANVLSKIITTSLPSGVLKIMVDGGSNNSSVLALQVNGRAIATLQVAYDTSPGNVSTVTTSAVLPSAGRAPGASAAQPMSRPRQR